jgi:hypothetical protein
MAERRPLIVMACNGRADNLGDVVIHRVLFRMLRRYGTVRVERPIAPDLGPPFCAGRGGAAGRASRRVWAMARARLGGQLVYRVAPPGHLLSVARDGRAPSRSTALIDAALGVRRVQLGISTHGSDAAPYVAALSRHHAVGARDAQSLELLAALGPRAAFFPDLAFLLRRLGLASAEVRPRERVVLSFRAAIAEAPRAEYREHVVAILDTLVPALSARARAPLRFVHQVDEDREFNETLAARYHAACGTTFLAAKVDSNGMAEAYADAAVVVSNRLHVGLVGAAFGALPLAVTSERHAKIVGVFRHAGWDELLVLNPEGAAAAAGAWEERRELLTARVDAAFSRYAGDAEASFARIFR